MVMTNEDNEFLIETLHVKPANVAMQNMIESTIQVFQESTLDCHIEAMVEAKFVSFLESGNHKTGKSKRTHVYQAVEKTVHGVVTGGAVHRVIHMKVDRLIKSQDFVEHIISNATPVKANIGRERSHDEVRILRL